MTDKQSEPHIISEPKDEYQQYRDGQFKDAEIARLIAELARANEPWSVRLVSNMDRYDCDVVDTGHADRVLIVECAAFDAARAALANLVTAITAPVPPIETLEPDACEYHARAHDYQDRLRAALRAAREVGKP
jgi:hypothetical protein